MGNVTPTQRALRAVLPFSLTPAAVVGLLLGFTVGLIPGVIAFVVVAAGLAVWGRWGGDRLVAARLGGRPGSVRPADPKEDARLCNLVEGLSTGAGVRYPKLMVVDSPGLNAMAAGSGPGRAVLAVTSGLLTELTRIELEAVLAEELWQIRHNEILPATVVVVTIGLGRKAVLTADRDSRADQGGISVTRYPPALAAALEKVESKGAVVAGQPGYMAHLWLADPRPDPPAGNRRLPLHERIEALREL